MSVSYEGGAARSESKPDYHLINPQFNRLVAEAMTEGRKSKGEYNYRSGGPEFIKSCYTHALEHLYGLIEEPEKAAEHIGHCAANLNMLVYFLYLRGHLDELAEAGISDYPLPEDFGILDEYIEHDQPTAADVLDLRQELEAPTGTIFEPSQPSLFARILEKFPSVEKKVSE